MNTNFKSEIELLFEIKKGKDEAKTISEIEKFGIEKPLKDGFPLFYAVLHNRDEVTRHLISKNVDVNVLYENNYTPLMASIDNTNKEMVKLLINSGANINLKDKHGNDALYKAVHKQDLEIIKILVDAGANPFVGDNPKKYSAYDSAKDMEADDIIMYFDSIRKNYL